MEGFIPGRAAPRRAHVPCAVRRCGLALALLFGTGCGGPTCDVSGTHALFARGVPGNASDCPVTLSGKLTVTSASAGSIDLGSAGQGSCDPGVQSGSNSECVIDMTCRDVGSARQLLAAAAYLPDDTTVHDESENVPLQLLIGLGDGGTGACTYNWTVLR